MIDLHNDKSAINYFNIFFVVGLLALFMAIMTYLGYSDQIGEWISGLGDFLIQGLTSILGLILQFFVWVFEFLGSAIPNPWG